MYIPICSMYLAHCIQQPIPKLQNLNFHKLFLTKNNNKWSNKTCVICSNRSENGNLWKFGFVISKLVVGSGEPDIYFDGSQNLERVWKS